jgi:hypothetical protein
MQRLEATHIAVELAGDAPIIGGVGNSTFDLVACDRPQNFYMWNSMGMASSIALGLALARPDLRVVVLDGDGSILMNLGSLATERSSGADNLVHVIWDNGGWQITGGQPAGSPFGVDLETVARGCAYRKTRQRVSGKRFPASVFRGHGRHRQRVGDHRPGRAGRLALPTQQELHRPARSVHGRAAADLARTAPGMRCTAAQRRRRR